MSTSHPIAAVAGVGPGLGAALCRRLAKTGYRVAGLARGTGYAHGLATEIANAGGHMQAYACDVTDTDSVRGAFEQVRTELGAPDVLVYNAGRFVERYFDQTTADDFRQLWRVNCLGGFLCASEVVGSMRERGAGVIVFTGATASVKAAAGCAAFGSAKFALRGLAQAMARELGPHGIHVAHVIVDGHIFSPRETDEPNVSEPECLDPEAIAQTYLHLIRQERSAWTLELDLRPDVEPF